MANIKQPGISEQIPQEEIQAAPQFEVFTENESRTENRDSTVEGAGEKEKAEAAAKALEKIQSSEAIASNNEKAEAKALTLEEKKELLVKRFAEIVTVAGDPIKAAERIFDSAGKKYLAKYPDMVKAMYIEIMDRLDKTLDSRRGRASGNE
ncbi:MAG: hypothetical protein WCX69_02710 [Candidatus Paceibacterota bacterium]